MAYVDGMPWLDVVAIVDGAAVPFGVEVQLLKAARRLWMRV